MNWEFIGCVLGIGLSVIGVLATAIGAIRWRRYQGNPMYRDEAIDSMLWIGPGLIVLVAGVLCFLFATT